MGNYCMNKSGNYYLTKVTNFASTFSFHHLLLCACAACKQDLYGSICSCDSWHMNIGHIIGVGVWIWCMKRCEYLSHLFMWTVKEGFLHWFYCYRFDKADTVWCKWSKSVWTTVAASLASGRIRSVPLIFKSLKLWNAGAGSIYCHYWYEPRAWIKQGPWESLLGVLITFLNLLYNQIFLNYCNLIHFFPHFYHLIYWFSFFVILIMINWLSNW